MGSVDLLKTNKEPLQRTYHLHPHVLWLFWPYENRDIDAHKKII